MHVIDLRSASKDYVVAQTEITKIEGGPKVMRIYTSNGYWIVFSDEDLEKIRQVL